MRRSNVFGFFCAALAALLMSAGAASAQKPKSGGTAILGIEGEPGSLVAFLATDTVAMMAAYNIFNGLVGLGDNLEIIPDLAEKWTVSPDGTVYSFELVKTAKWHDGRPVTSEDVVFTLTELVGKVHPRASSWWPNVTSVTATGPHGVEIKLRQPFAPFLSMLGSVLSSGTLIVPKHIWEKGDPKANPANSRPIGSGPFKFVTWEKGSHIELERNPNYFKTGKPYLDRLVFKVAPDASARMVAFERGEIDFLHWYIVPYDRIGQLRKDARFQLINRGDAAATNGLLLMNHRHPHLKDVRVRKAIAHAVDRKDVVAKALFGEAKVARSHIGSSLAGFFTDKFDYALDVAKANALLDEAGLPRGADGKRFSLRLSWASGRDYEGRAAEIVKDNLRAIGIDVTIQVLDRPAFIDKVFRNWDFDLATQLFTTGPDPTVSVTPRYHSSQIKKAPFVNAMGYSNPEVDKLFDTETQIIDKEKRREAWIKIQELLLADLPALPLFELPPIHAASSNLKDFVTGPQGYIESRENAYFEK